MNIKDLVTVRVGSVEATPLPPRPAIHPECFHLTMDRHVYMAAFIQELEDAAHNRENSEATRGELDYIGRRWLGPVFRLWDFRNVEIKVVGLGIRATLQIGFPSGTDESGRFAQCEPVLWEFMNTPEGWCACQHVPGVIHSHGDQS